MKNRLYVGMALMAAVAGGGILHASEGSSINAVPQVQAPSDAGAIEAPALTIDSPEPAAATDKSQAAPEQSAAPAYDSAPVLTLDAGGVASRLHGFGSFSINSQYITPRGLVAEKKSPQFQSLLGLVLDVYHGDGVIDGVSLNAGTWGDFNTHPSKAVVTGADIWTEEDYFAGFDVKFLKKFDFSYSIEAWTFPDLTAKGNEIDPTTEYNMEFKVGYDDSDLLKAFAVHPYVNVFWNYAGASSPVVANALLGKNDHTFYVEVGGAPSYTLKAIDNFPITFTMPTYVSVGDSSFWGEAPDSHDRSNLGVISTGLKVSVPLSFIPQDFGNWNAFAGVTWIYTANPGLTYVNNNLDGTGDTHNRVLGTAGVGFNF